MRRLTATVMTFVAIVGTGSAFGRLRADGRTATDAELPDMVGRFLASERQPLESYRCRRVLEASTRGGRTAASMEVWTELRPDGTFHFEVVREEGSGLIRGRVLREALLQEQASRRPAAMAETALSPVNYEFDTSVAGSDGLLAIGLRARRETPMLVNGAIFVRPGDGDLVRVEGMLAKAPSLWTPAVNIVRRYARIGGIRVPVSMESRARVRVVGESHFSMTYQYSRINGRNVEGVAPDGPALFTF